MRANRIDTNQTQIVADLRGLGYKVLSIAALKNCCDLIVFNGDRNEFFEVKNPEYCSRIIDLTQGEREKFLTEGEAKFADQFRVWIVINAEEVDKVFNGKMI
jgi:predicted ATP-grasp superfamily ATP-dependent carboligase